MKTSETKLAAKEQNDTRRLCEDRGVSLHRSEAFILPPSLHLCHSLFDLCWLTLPFSPSPPSNNEMTCSPDSNFLPLPPLLFFLLLSIFSPSDFLLSLSSTCLRNVSEQHKRTKAWGRRRKERRGRRGRRRRRGERKLSGGKGETERLRGAESRMNGSEWRAVLCHHVLTSSISHTHTHIFIGPFPLKKKTRTHDEWGRRGCKCAALPVGYVMVIRWTPAGGAADEVLSGRQRSIVTFVPASVTLEPGPRDRFPGVLKRPRRTDHRSCGKSDSRWASRNI